MDYQYYGQENPYRPPYSDKRSSSMTTAAMILGVASLVTCTCLYVSVVCGGMAILLALLSKGGEMTLSHNAKLALGFGIAGLCATVLLYGISFATILQEYGSLEEYLKSYLQDYGMSLEDLMY
jgi:predicted histidine transporter YuiF (NhaC family)